MAGSIIPTGVKFNFWSSMADLARLVMRSRAQGLRTRLAAALALVLVGKWTGVVAPLLLSHAIDAINRGRSGDHELRRIQSRRDSSESDHRNPHRLRCLVDHPQRDGFDRGPGKAAKSVP